MRHTRSAQPAAATRSMSATILSSPYHRQEPEAHPQLCRERSLCSAFLPKFGHLRQVLYATHPTPPFINVTLMSPNQALQACG